MGLADLHYPVCSRYHFPVSPRTNNNLKRQKNYFAASDTVAARTVLSRVKEFFYLTRGAYKKVPVTYVSGQSGAGSQHLMPEFEAVYKEIKTLLSEKNKFSFLCRVVFLNIPDRKGSGIPVLAIFVE